MIDNSIIEHLKKGKENLISKLNSLKYHEKDEVFLITALTYIHKAIQELKKIERR